MGLLDTFLKGTGDPERDAAINNGLLQAGLALMQSRGRLFPAIGQAGQVGLQAAQQTRAQQMATRRAGLQDKLIQNQLGQQQREAELAALPGQFYRAPSQPGVDATGGMETAVEAPNNASGPGGFDMQGYIQAMMSKSPMQGLQLQAAMAKDESPIAVAKDTVLIDRKTKLPIFSNVQSENKTPEDIIKYQYAVGQGYQGTFEEWDLARRKAAASQMNNYGSPTAGVDPRTGNPAFAVTDKQGNVKVLSDIVPKPSAADEASAKEKKTRELQGKQMISAMDQARTILTQGKPTASGIGNVVDAAARWGGQTTVGAQDAAKLEALSGWLVANVPRMEGPQSNIDVINYTTMAGKVGDRTVPVKERLAALEQVEQLQRKYAEINGTPMPAAAKPAAVGGPYNDPDKERRYQEWKAKQGQK